MSTCDPACGSQRNRPEAAGHTQTNPKEVKPSAPARQAQRNPKVVKPKQNKAKENPKVGPQPSLKEPERS